MTTPTPRRPRAGVPGRPPLGGARALAALALCGAAGIHLAQGLRHLPEPSFHGRLHATFFLAAALLQALAAAFLGRPPVAGARRRSGRAARLVAAATLGLAGVWAVAVTAGLPSGLAPGSPEPVTPAGVAAAGAELLAAGALLAAILVTRRERRHHPTTPRSSGPAPRPAPARRRLPAPVAASGVVLLAAGWALPASADGHRHAGTTDLHHEAADGGDRRAGASQLHRAAAHAGPPADGDLAGVAALAGPPLAGSEVHLHGLGGDRPDPGPDPVRRARGPLAGTRLRAGLEPAAVAVDGGVVWVADREGGVVRRLDARSGRPLGPPSPVGVHPGGIAVGAGGVWVTNAGSDTVTRLDPVTGDHAGTIPVGKVPVGVAVGGGLVWVANSAEGTVSRIDPVTGVVVTTPRIGYGPTAITLAGGRAWVVAALDRALVSLDLATADVLGVTPVDGGAASVAFGHGSLWVASSSAGTVARIDPATGAVLGPPVVVDGYSQPGRGPAALAVGERVWVLNNHDRTVVAVDPATGDVSPPRFLHRRVARHGTPASLALAETGELWATDAGAGAVVRLQARKDS